VQDVNKVWFEVRALNVHSVCDELLIPLSPLYIYQCTKMFMLILDINQLLGTTQQLNQVCQVGLQLLKKGTKFYEKYGSMNACRNFFHSISLSHTFCPIPRIPKKKVSGSHSGVMIYPLDFQVRSPPNPYRCSFLYASNFTTHTIFRRHQHSTSTFDQS
jgi:hypothetical protein